MKSIACAHLWQSTESDGTNTHFSPFCLPQNPTLRNNPVCSCAHRQRRTVDVRVTASRKAEQPLEKIILHTRQIPTHPSSNCPLVIIDTLSKKETFATGSNWTHERDSWCLRAPPHRFPRCHLQWLAVIDRMNAERGSRALEFTPD